MVPRMGVTRFLPSLIETAVQYVKDNNRLFNPIRLDSFSFFYENASKRVYSLSQKHIILHDLRRFLIEEYLKQNL